MHRAPVTPHAMDCAQVLKEVRSVYKVVCEGVLNLVDKFFEMDRGDALKVRGVRVKRSAGIGIGVGVVCDGGLASSRTRSVGVQQELHVVGYASGDAVNQARAVLCIMSSPRHWPSGGQVARGRVGANTSAI